MPRKRTVHTSSFEERCAAQAEAKLEIARKLPPGPEREKFEREARQISNAIRMDGWLKAGE